MAKPQKSAPASTEDGGAGEGASDSPTAPHHIPAQPGGAEEQVTADPPAYGEVKDQLGDLRTEGIDAAGGKEDEGKGDEDVPGTGVLVPIAPELEEKPQPEVTYDVAPLEPLDSSEAWKEQTRVPTGDADSGADTKRGHRAGEDSKADPHATPDPDEFASHPGASIEENAKRYQTVSTRPDGTPTAGIGPNSVVQIPDDVPAPINPLSDSASHQDRVLYENWVNGEAENFANEARTRFINAAIAGKSLSITGDEDDGTGQEQADVLGVDDPETTGTDTGDRDRDEQTINEDPNVNAGLTPKE